MWKSSIENTFIIQSNILSPRNYDKEMTYIPQNKE